MEGSVFPASAVAEELRENYIEARLHTDRPGKDEGRKQLQVEMTNDYSNPIYFLYDPVTSKQLGKRAGYVLEKKFLEFLQTK
ncbi:MAG: hypothetical protein IPJ77_23890 [Planctomycetes bacterium]|nr:hypothetical protein [Planctomycetota bacterium]